MNFKDLDIKASYISYGSQNIASCLINPALVQILGLGCYMSVGRPSP